MNPEFVIERLGSNIAYLPALLNVKQKIWDPSFIVQYPAFLRSAAHPELLPAAAKKGCFVFIDSGGFSLLTGAVDAASYNAKYVMEVANYCGDAVATLDFPPVTDMCGPVQAKLHYVDDKEYERRLKYSAENAAAMRQLARNDLLLYVVCQGNTWERMEQWLKLSDPTEEAKCICVTPKPPSQVDAVMLHLCFAAQSGMECVHMFAVASWKVILMLEYARRHSKIKLFTFDSTEFADGTRLRVYYSPLNIKREIIRSDEPRFRHSPCSCPACSSWDWTGNANTDMMDLHNLLMLDRRTRLASAYTNEALEEEIIDKIGFKKFCEFRDSLEQGYENVKHKGSSLDHWITT